MPAITVARFVWIFGADRIRALLERDPLGTRAATVMSWAGMRGVVTLAVALTLPEAMPGRDLILVSAFAVIVVTVLVQGTTLGLVIRRAALEEDPRSRPPLDLNAAEVVLMKAQHVAVERLAYDADGTLVHPRLLERYRLRATSADTFTEPRKSACASSPPTTTSSSPPSPPVAPRSSACIARTRSTTRPCTISSVTSTSRS